MATQFKFKAEIRMTHGAKTSSSSYTIQYYAVLKARNGEIVFTGETRKRKSALIKTINNLFPGVVIVDKTQSKK